MSKNAYFQDNPECNICSAPFFTDPNNVIADEPCHFSRNGGTYCGLCYSFLVSIKTIGMMDTVIRMQTLTTYLNEIEGTYPEAQLKYYHGGKKNVDNVISAIKLFKAGEDVDGDN